MSEQRFFDNLTQYDSGNGTPSERRVYLYDAFGREVQVTHHRSDGPDVWSTEYDADGRVIRLESPQGAVNYEYDLATGHRTRTFTGDSGSYAGDQNDPVNDFHYTYDILGRLETVEVHERNDTPLSTTEVTDYDYDLLGNLDLMTTPDGVITDYIYDELNRLDEQIAYRPDGTPGTLTDNDKLAEFDYTVRADGKRDSADEIIYDSDGIAKLSHTQFDWTYDNAGRLIDEVFTDVGNLLADADNYHTTFEYDLTGNRLKQTTITDDDGTAGFNAATDTDKVVTYGQDVNDRMTSESRVVDGVAVDTTTYGYTGTQQSSKTVTNASSTVTSFTSFAYDLQGRLSHVEVHQGDSSTNPSSIIDYRYGPDGIRISSTTHTDSNADGIIDSIEKTEYLIDAQNHTGYQQVLEETVYDVDPTTGAETEVKKIVYTIGHDLISQTTFTPGGDPQGETLVFHYDGHGSTRVLTDLAGAIVTAFSAQQIFHYTAYGEMLGVQAANAATTLLYSGEQFDVRIGKQYLRARYYDAVAGTFNRLDPFSGNFQDSQSLHKYLYAHADPVNGIDPTGLVSLASAVTVGAIGATLGAISTGAVFLAAGRSASYGFLTGAFAGAALGYAYYTGSLKEVVGEAILASVVVVGTKLLHDKFVPPQGANSGQPITYIADALEAFNWGLIIGAWAHHDNWGPDGPSGNNPSAQHLAESTTIGWAQMAVTIGSIVVSALSAGVSLALGEDVSSVKSQARANLAAELKVAFRIVVGSFIPLLDSAAGEWTENVPGIRVLGPRQRGQVIENLLDVAIAATAGGNFSLDQLVSNGADKAADAIVDFVFRFFE